MDCIVVLRKDCELLMKFINFSDSPHEIKSTKSINFTTDKLLEVIQSLSADKETVMVFCNNIQSCRFVDHFLNQAGIKTACYHGGIPPNVSSLS